MKNVFVYARYSSSMQTKMSIKAQVRAVKKYCKKKGYKIIKIYADEHVIIGTSGENLVKSRVSALVPFLFYIKGSPRII